MVIFGSLMYLIEGPQYGFTTLNASVYWAIVTITTVGMAILRRIRRSANSGLGSDLNRLFHYCHSDRAYHHAYDQRISTSPRVSNCQHAAMIKTRVFATPAAVNCGIVRKQNKTAGGVVTAAFFVSLAPIHATEYGTAYGLFRGTAERAQRYR
jgi:hypothetical protein